MTGYDGGPADDDERERLVAALHRHVAAGRLDLAGFDARAAAVYGAASSADAAGVLADLPPLPPPGPRGRRGRRRHGEPQAVLPHWQPTGEVFRDPSSGRVMRVWVDPTDGTRHYADAPDPPPG